MVEQSISSLIDYSEGGVLSKVILKSDKLNITLFCMGKGTEISEHTSTKSGFVYVVEGDGIFTLQGRDIAMSPGTFINMESNAVHALQANENTSFLLALSN